MQFRCTLLSSAKVSSSPRFIDCGSVLVLLDLHSFRCFRITWCTHHADSWSQLQSIAPESMHPPRASDMRNTLQRHSRDPAESYLERRRASMGQKLIRPADLISWAYPHHNSQYVLYCVALTAALPWLCGTQLKGPAGVGWEPVWVFIYPRSTPRARGQCLAVPRHLQKSLDAAVTRWRPLDALLQGLLELREHFEAHLVGFVQGLSGRESQQGMRLQAPLEPLLCCAMVDASPPVPAQWLSCHGLAGQACSLIHLAKHAPLIFLILKKKLVGKAPHICNFFNRGSRNILRRGDKNCATLQDVNSFHEATLVWSAGNYRLSQANGC